MTSSFSPVHTRGRGGKSKESLQLRLWNLNSTSNSPVTPLRLSCQREAETSASVNNHWKARDKGNDFNTNVISANQHFVSTLSMYFSMQIFKLIPAPVAPPERPGEFARRLSPHENNKPAFWKPGARFWKDAPSVTVFTRIRVDSRPSGRKKPLFSNKTDTCGQGLTFQF